MDKFTIGIVEPDSQIYRRVGKSLSSRGCRVYCFAPADIPSKLSGRSCDLLIAADPLPGMPTVQLLDCLEMNTRALPVILMAEKAAMKQVVSAMRHGVRDYLLFSDDDDLIRKSIEGALKKGARVALPPTGADHPVIITRTPAMQTVLDMARRIAASAATVLIQGESGTGKELVARYIHSNSDRIEHPFVAMNCAALPEQLAESELFGHEKGAFTGAIQRKRGKFEQADKGTLLLDEISEMPLTLQAKLLRVLQEREVDPVGAQRPVSVNVRIIATTNRDLAQMVAEARFRNDLYYRVRVIPITLPPLRQRPLDIPLLIDHFVQKCSPPGSSSHVQFTDAAMAKMLQWSWPGNVRELENAIQRALLICPHRSIGPEFLLLDEPAQRRDSSPEAQLVGMTVKELEERLIAQTLKHVHHNRTHAAEMLGISIRTLRNKLREYRQEGEMSASVAGNR